MDTSAQPTYESKTYKGPIILGITVFIYDYKSNWLSYICKLFKYQNEDNWWWNMKWFIHDKEDFGDAKSNQ